MTHLCVPRMVFVTVPMGNVHASTDIKVLTAVFIHVLALEMMIHEFAAGMVCVKKETCVPVNRTCGKVFGLEINVTDVPKVIMVRSVRLNSDKLSSIERVTELR